jgi:signal transduction histidine kinase
MKTAIKDPVLKGFEKYSIKSINNFKRILERNLNNESLSTEEKLEKVTYIAKKQQELLENMVSNEESVFSQVANLMSYKALAQRGLAFMAGGHEICGLFMRLQSVFKRTPELNIYLDDINRLDEIFEGQMAVANTSYCYEEYTVKSIVDHFDNLYKRYTKEIIFTESFHSMKINHSIRKTKMITIIGNLISNGLYFGTKVVVDYVDGKIVVSDNGDGLEIKDQDKLFSFGFTNKGDRGHGAGLFLSREMAREMKLELSFDSTNKYTDLTGASFVFDLNE